MPRIVGVDLPKDKNTWTSLTYLYGIGKTTAMKILAEAGIDPNKRAKDLTEKDVSEITSVIQRHYRIEGDLRREVQQNIKRLMDVRTYKGIRHIRGLPVNGQRTHTNARTRKGGKRTVGGLSKKPPSPK